MTKNLWKIITLLCLLSSRTYSNKVILISSQNDWELGYFGSAISTGQSGVLRLSTGYINGYDDFTAAKNWWTRYNVAMTNGVMHSSAFGTRAGVWSGSFPGNSDFSFETSIVQGCSGCGANDFNGGIGVEYNGIVASVASIGSYATAFGQVPYSKLVFANNAGGAGTINVAVGTLVYLRLKKYSQAYIAEYRFDQVQPWQTLGSMALTFTPQVQSIFIGTYGSSGFYSTTDYGPFKMTPFSDTGTWTSAPLDLTGVPTTQGTIRWSQDLEAGTRIEIQTATSSDGQNWSAWSTPFTDEASSYITSVSRRYIRVAATLYSDHNKLATPVLKDITIEYPDAKPLAPVTTSSSHAAGLWSSKNTANMLWAMPANNPAPESTYKYWLTRNGSITATASIALSPSTVGQSHGVDVVLPQEGSYAFGLTVTADAFSGGLTSVAAPYLFGFDATAPGQTQIVSPTHPQLLFTNNNAPVFKLKALDALSGVSGYAALLDKVETGDPGSVVNSGEDVRSGKLDNGTYYLHARAIDMAGNTGPVSHYGIRIDFNGALLSADYVKALPNPVRSNTALLEYELAAPATEVVLEFLNSQGELLKTVDGSKIVGKNSYRWDVTGLANGIYLFRVRARSSEDGKSYSVVRKVAVIR